MGCFVALTDAMRVFVRDPAERIGTMGRGGRVLAEEWFAVRTVNATMMQTLGINMIEPAAGEGKAA